MSYSFTRDDADVAQGLRRIALDQIDRAMAESADPDLPMAERIHQLRKRCKKLRGLIRLVRPVFDDYGAENAAFREAARRLSDVRDAAALVETCDALTARFADRLSDGAFDDLRRRLVAEARAREKAGDVEDRMEQSRADLRAARERAAGWILDRDGAPAVARGATKTVRRARKAMRAARRDPGEETFHEWRKRVKYHWYHMRLLKNVSPLIAAQAEVAGRLAEDLGDHHDTHVMAAALDRLSGDIPAEGAEALRGLLLARRAALAEAALRTGGALFAETPKGYGRRIAGYWKAREAEAP